MLNTLYHYKSDQVRQMQVVNQWRLLPLGILGLAWLVYRLYWVLWPGEDIAGIESVFVFYALQFAEGVPIYSDYTLPPFADCQYTPLSIVFNAQIIRLSGITDDLSSIYILLRSISLLLNLLAAGLLADVFRHYRIGYSKQIIGAMLVFLCLFNAHEFGIRPDVWKTFFVCLALWFTERGAGRCSPVWSAAGFAMASVLAFWTKQDALVCVLLMLWYMHRKQQFELRNYSLYFTATGLLLSSALFVLIWGKPLIQNMLIVFRFSYHPVYMWKEVLLPALPWLILLFSVRFIRFFQKDRIKRSFVFPSWLLLPVFILAGMKWGATPVYFQEVYLFTALSIMTKMRDGLFRPLLLVIMIAVTGAVSGQMPIPRPDDDAKLKEHRNRSESLIYYLEKKYTNKWYLFTFDRNLIVLGRKRALFPAYETIHPEMLISTFGYGEGRYHWQDAFPNLPQFHLWLGADHFQPDRPVIAVVPSGQDMKSFYALQAEDFKLESRHPGFDVYLFVPR